MEYGISSADKQILREVAKKHKELAAQERNAVLKERWYRHNALQGEIPMVVLESWGFNNEVITPRLKCTGDFARKVEFDRKRQIFLRIFYFPGFLYNCR